jgi:hypothetical protein
MQNYCLLANEECTVALAGTRSYRCLECTVAVDHPTAEAAHNNAGTKISWVKDKLLTMTSYSCDFFR